MSGLKRAAVVAFAFGVGVGLVALGATAFLSWRAERPRQWNTTAITAAFDYIDTEGENKLVFYYVLENHRDRDFRITSPSEVVFTARLDRQKSLSPQHPADTVTGEMPVFLPARQRVRFGIHLGALGYAYTGKTPLLPGATRIDREANARVLAAFVREELSNLAGFVLFHEPSRYQVEFPRGW